MAIPEGDPARRECSGALLGGASSAPPADALRQSFERRRIPQGKTQAFQISGAAKPPDR